MAYKVNLVIDGKTDFQHIFELNDENNDDYITNGYTANGAIKKSYSSLNYIAVFQTELSNGNLIIKLSNEQTANITPGRYLYDVIIKDSSNVISRVVEGMVTVTPGIT